MADATELLNTATTVLQDFNRITSIQDALVWDERAEESVSHMQLVIAACDEEIARVNAEADAAKIEHGKLGFWKRSTTADPSIAIRLKANDYVRAKEAAQSVIDKLNECIDMTPDSIEDAKQRIQELKLYKKELAIDKKEATNAMRAARETARAKVSNVTLLHGKSGRWARDMARLQKEKALRSGQSERDRIEAQMIEIDRRVLWLEKFTKK